MKGAIMQPYFFPYLGYYQLAYAVEKFIFLDDVNFIKQGYINRNSILLNEKQHRFSIPVSKISSYRKINDHHYLEEYSTFIKLLENAYKKAPFFLETMQLISSITRDQNSNVAYKNAKTITAVFDYLSINRKFSFSSATEEKSSLKGEDRVIYLCKKSNITEYINAIGGKNLYDKTTFNSEGITIKFIKISSHYYSQATDNFTPYLSMIDILMHCEKQEIKEMLSKYELTE